MNLMKKILLLIVLFLNISCAFCAQFDDVQIFYVDPLIHKKPDNNCNNEACKSLLNLIDKSKESINFAIYGIGDEDKIYRALINAKKRGVKIQGVTDMNINNKNPYFDTWKLIDDLEFVKTDYLSDLRLLEEQKIKQNYSLKIKDYAKIKDGNKIKIPGAIMHNKFFIVDSEYVWTGSTNVSSSCMSYNANNVILIKSKEVAKVYQKEFEEMFNKNNFHKYKNKTSNGQIIKVGDDTELKVFFSPSNPPNDVAIRPLIENAKNYIYVPMFFLTNRKLINSLIAAKSRDVDVKIIVDSAANIVNPQYVKLLRKNNVPVKVENWGGKMHMKSAVIDDRHIVIGSMNWTGVAQNSNDENTIVLDNSKLAKDFKKKFLYLWMSIPDGWLYGSPKPESKDSIGSCSDGIDNDHDGLVDKDDPDCSL